MIKSVYRKTTQKFAEFFKLTKLTKTKNTSPLTVAGIIAYAGATIIILGALLEVQAQNEIMFNQGVVSWEEYVQNIRNQGVFDLVRMGFYDIFTGENTLKAANEGRKLFVVGTGITILSVPAGIIKWLSDAKRKDLA